ncbi:hypothetical protein ACHQM5_025591 [Ranunculus cassubicifolius]
MLFANVRAKVPAIIVFGDSTVDAGNNNYVKTIAKSNFYPYGRDFNGGQPTGRFCNGRLVTDFLSEAFGIKPFIPAYLDPAYGIKDFATGVCFASAGTGYDNLTSLPLGVIPLWKELEYFKTFRKKLLTFMGTYNGIKRLQDSLYLISIENLILEIYQLGARKISVPGLPPFGCLPIVRSLNGEECREDFNDVARSYNAKFKILVTKLNKKLNGINLLYADVFTPALHVINNPQAYGFESAALGCCGTGTIELSVLCNMHNPLTCTDANKYVFWDSVHPTEKLYRIIANDMMKTTLAQFL